MSPDFIIRPAVQSDQQSILASYALAFRDNRTQDVWQWIYRDNPDESQSMLCLSKDGVVAAHSGVSFHRAIYEGEIVKLGQCRDAFSHPKFRFVMQGRFGLFPQTARSLFEQYGLAKGVMFHYGFPSARHLRLGCKQLNYQEGNNWGCFVYDTRMPQPHFNNSYGSLTVSSSFGEDFDRLWQGKEKSIKAGIIHDSRFLSWRFHQHSKHNYWLWIYTPYLSAKMMAYVIFSRSEHKAMLLDYHFPVQSKACLDFWGQIVEKLSWHGIEKIETYLSLNHPELVKLQEVGFVQCAIPENIKYCFRLYEGGPDWETVNQKFCFTLADSDLY